MIFLTVITEENLSVESIGRWYDNDYEETTYIIKHLFCLNPQNEKMYFGIPGNYVLSSPIGKIKDILSPQQTDCILSSYGWETHERSYEKRTSYHMRQYIDKKTTYEVCQLLNEGLGFTLYCPCVCINPTSTNTAEQTSGGRRKRIYYPHYLPSPICCVWGVNSKVMSKVNMDDFMLIPHSVKEKNMCTFKSEETIILD